jgi:hypothetical protein
MSAQLPAPRLADPGWDREPDIPVYSPPPRRRAQRRARRRRPLASTALALGAPVAGLLALGAIGAVTGTGGADLGSLPGADGLTGSSSTALVEDEAKAKRKPFDERAEPSSKDSADAAKTSKADSKPKPEPRLDGPPQRPTPGVKPVPTPPPPEEGDEEEPPSGGSGSGSGGSGHGGSSGPD